MTRDDATKARREEALRRFERATELPLLLLAIAMIPLIVVPLVVDLPETVADAVVAADWFIWAAFAFEYVTRLCLTNERARFVRREWADLLIVVLPFARPLRIARSARALRVLRLVRLAAFVGEIGKEARRLLTRHHLHYVLLVALAGVLVAAGLVTILEDGQGGRISDFGDALWWAITTVTTVGYGDTYPVTDAGRGIAAVLMVGGITLFGLLTANLAAFILERARGDSEPAADATEQKLDLLLARMATLEASIEAVRSRLAEPG
jgi:voltage-gated potassium channel